MSRNKSIAGFDYKINRPVERPLKEWREQLTQLQAKGGFRRVDGGETFGHDQKGIIAFEIYATVRAA